MKVEPPDSGLPLQIFKKIIEPNQQQKDVGFKQLQKFIKKKAEQMNITQLEKVITYFRQNYIRNINFKNKKLGLQVFTYISAGLQSSNTEASKLLIFMIVHPILNAMTDNEEKVKFTAIKSIYYITKTIGELTLFVFNDIFQNLVKRMADDQEVRSSGTLLNQTLKTFVSSHDLAELDTKRLIKTIVENIKSNNHHIKIFLVDWLDTLNEIPSLKIIMYLDLVLSDLLFMLGDKQLAVKNVVERCLTHFMQDFKRVYKEGKLQIVFKQQNLVRIVSILIQIIKNDSMLAPSKLQAITWFQHIFTFFKEDTLPKPANYKYMLKKILIDKFDQILQPILKLLSYHNQSVRNLANTVNQQLLITMQTVKRQEPVNFNKVMPMLKELLTDQKSNNTSDCILAWMKFMLQNYNKNIVPEIDGIIQKLVQKLCEGSSKNVMGIIQNVSFNECYFVMVIEKLLTYIKNNVEGIKPHRVIKHLCNALNIQKAFRVIADQLKKIKDRRFATEIISALLHILVTTQNTLLAKIKKLPENIQLFKILYECFCANPPCLMALCFMTGQYQVAYETIKHLCLNCQLNYIMLEQFSRVACMLESSCFVQFRLHVLQKGKHAYLQEALSVLLMILPYGPVQATLLNRMNFDTKLRFKEGGRLYKVDADECMQMFEKSISHLIIR